MHMVIYVTWVYIYSFACRIAMDDFWTLPVGSTIDVFELFTSHDRQFNLHQANTGQRFSAVLISDEKFWTSNCNIRQAKITFI